jgi:hypothetical protein
MNNIMGVVQREAGVALVCVHLVDSFVLCDSARFLSGMLLSLNAMLMLALPHVNILSKMDLLPKYGETGFLLILILIYFY